jgi:hypothetical protein
MKGVVIKKGEGNGGGIAKRHILLAGGGGFLGTILGKIFLAHGDEVVVLTRSPRDRADGAREVAWDAKTIGDWAKLLDETDVVINLTGKSVDCRYHERNRREIIASRVDSTRVIGEAIENCARPPRVWLNASSATVYKHTFDRRMDETGEIGATPEAKDAFSIEVIRQWEQAFTAAKAPATRKVALRAALVLGREGGAFPVFRRLARLGLGGAMGDGRQLFSWVHAEDFCRAIEWIMGRDDCDGIVNIAAPDPLPNHETMRLIRQACGRSFGLPAKKWMLEAGALLLRTETELLIKSRYVVPGKLVASGFQFKFPTLREALADLRR